MNAATIYGHLNTLCKTIGERPTGSLSNRQAMEYIGKYLECMGYPVTYQIFDCRDWKVQAVSCSIMGKKICVIVNPHSPSCTITAPVILIKNLGDLRACCLKNSIAILYGDIAKEPLMPKKFPFYQPEEHLEIIRLLEEKQPQAVIFICPGDNAIPVIVDGDFLIPSGTTRSNDGSILLDNPGGLLTLFIDTDCFQTRAANVICQTPGQGKKIVLCAHFDSKYYTPGALDNASGVAALLVLADRLRRGAPQIPLEFVFFNGEECYNIPGEMSYFSSGAINSDTVLLAINIDGIGLNGYPSSIAYFSCPHEIMAASEEVRLRYPGVTKVDPWPQGDHMIFTLKDIPAMAFTTSAEWNVIEKIIHTTSDTMNQLDIGKIMHTIDAIDAIVRKVSGL